MPTRLPVRGGTARRRVGTRYCLAQNSNFAPNWKIRGSLVPDICPKLPSVTPVSGLVNCVWLKVLNVSTRNSTLARSLNANALNIEMFQLLRPGPTTSFRAAVPHCRGAGLANDEVLNHSNRVFS